MHRLEAGGPVVGLLSSATYQEQRLTLEPGDLLLAYTNGISEAMTKAEKEWGEERMLAAADRFTLNAAQYDDMTLLVLKLTAT